MLYKVLATTAVVFSNVLNIASADWANPSGGARIGTAENFDEIIESNELVLVNFYAPWCGHSQNLLPEFDAAADVLVDEEFKSPQAPVLLKVDLVEHEDLYWKFDIKGFPSVRLFRRGEEVDEVLQRTKDQIVSYISKRVDYRPKMFESVADVSGFVARGKWNGEEFEESPSVIAFFDESNTESGNSEWETFTNVALKMSQSIPISGTASVEAAKEYGITPPAILLLKEFDEKKNVLPLTADTNTSSVVDFITNERYPRVIKFERANNKWMFVERPGFNNHIITFVDDDTTEAFQNEVYATMDELAMEYKNEAIFIYAGPDQAELMEQFDVKPQDLPAVRFVSSDSEAGKINFFIPEDTGFSNANLKKFISSTMSGLLEPHLLGGSDKGSDEL